MTDPQLGLLGIAVLFVLIALRVPIAIALTGVSFIGIWYLIGWMPAFGTLKDVPYHFAANWELSSVPMFLLMGYLAYYTGITRGLFAAAQLWLSRLPGGLAIASIMGTSGFAAVTGSSVACAAAMGRIAVPEMLRHRYDPGLAAGTVAAAGTLGALIPPSILLIIYGVFAQVPVPQLFIGGAIVGFMSAAAWVALIIIWAKLDPSVVPKVEEKYPLVEKIRALAKVGPVILLGLLVFGGLFGGFFTPTEAGAVGAAFVALIAWFGRTLNWNNFKLSVIESFATTASIFVIAIGAHLLTRFVAISGADVYVLDLFNALGSNTVLLFVCIIALYLFLGMFLDPLGAMLLTLPILLPVIRAAGLDLIWFGIVMAKLLEMGLITPPVGLNVFVLKSVVGDTIPLGKIFSGVGYFLIADLVVVFILIAFPEVILFIPRLMS